MPKPEHTEDNVRLVKAFRPLPPAEMKAMSGRLSEKNKAALDPFFRTHVDGQRRTAAPGPPRVR
jgi:hypothetical protein